MLTQIDYLTPEKSETLIAEVANPKHKVMILLMHDAGLRVSEAVSLKLSDFDFKKRVINVHSLKKRRKKNTKRGDRPIPISSRLYNAIANYLKEENDVEGWLFPSDKNPKGHITRYAASYMLSRFKKKHPEFHELRPHILRHTFASNLLKEGADLTTIRDLLGHEDIRTTTIYTHTPQEVVRQQIERATQKHLTIQEKIRRWFRGVEVETNRINIGQKNTFVVGRRAELDRLENNIRKNINTIVLGDIGVGKSTLLESVGTDKKVLLISDTTAFKSTLINTLMHLFSHDKKKVMEMVYPKHTLDNVRTPLTKHNTVDLAKTLVDITSKHEYVLMIDNVDRITAGVVKVLETLKDHFTIITTARSVPINRGSFLWGFEKISLGTLQRGESLELIHRLAYDVEVEDQEMFRNHIWEQSNGNPRVIFELVERYRKETFVTNDVVRQVRHYGALPEWDLSIIVLLFLGGLAILRYLAYETGDSSLRFIGGAAMILLIIFRQFFSKTKRKYFK